MKSLTLFSAILLSSCARDIASLPRNERLTLYGTAAAMSGHPEYTPILYGLRTSAKQPVELDEVEITLEGPEPQP
jgi:hypothetical protein